MSLFSLVGIMFLEGTYLFHLRQGAGYSLRPEHSGVEELLGSCVRWGVGNQTERHPVGDEARGDWRAETPAPVLAPLLPCCVTIDS